MAQSHDVFAQFQVVCEGPDVYALPHDPDGRTQTKTQRIEALANNLTVDISRKGGSRVLTFPDGSTLTWDGRTGASATDADPEKAYETHAELEDAARVLLPSA